MDARTLAELQERRRIMGDPSSDTDPAPVTVRDEETQAERPGLLCASEVSE